MKGTIHKLNENWIVKSSSNKQYPLHPDDLTDIIDNCQTFPDYQERIFAQPNVEFKLIKKYPPNQTITYAKLIPNIKNVTTDLNPNEWILIKKETLDNLIHNFKENDVDTEVLVALFKWLAQNNTLKNK